MDTNVLDRIFGNGFDANSLPASSANALVAILDRAPELQEIRLALADGVISVSSIKNRIERALGDFHQDQWFPHTPGISVLLLAMCHRYDPDAERCLDLISQLRQKELRIIRDTAKLCLARKSLDPQQTERSLPFPPIRFESETETLESTQLCENMDGGDVTVGEHCYATA